jgi:hypothetical protein
LGFESSEILTGELFLTENDMQRPRKWQSIGPAFSRSADLAEWEIDADPAWAESRTDPARSSPNHGSAESQPLGVFKFLQCGRFLSVLVRSDHARPSVQRFKRPEQNAIFCWICGRRGYRLPIRIDQTYFILDRNQAAEEFRLVPEAIGPNNHTLHEAILRSVPRGVEAGQSAWSSPKSDGAQPHLPPAPKAIISPFRK